DWLRELEVVVEAVLDRRPDSDLDARVEPSHRLGEQVRRGVAQDVQGVGVVLVPSGQDLDALPVLEGEAEVLGAPVRAQQDGLFGELRTDRARGVEPRCALGQFQFRAVREDDLHEGKDTRATASRTSSQWSTST